MNGRLLRSLTGPLPSRGPRLVLFPLAMTKSICIALALALAGCGEQRPAAPTAEQNDQLNEAEAMLNEEGPEAEAPDPSNWD